MPLDQKEYEKAKKYLDARVKVSSTKTKVKIQMGEDKVLLTPGQTNILIDQLWASINDVTQATAA